MNKKYSNQNILFYCSYMKEIICKLKVLPPKTQEMKICIMNFNDCIENLNSEFYFGKSGLIKWAISKL